MRQSIGESSRGLVLLLVTGSRQAAASEGMSLFGDLKYRPGLYPFRLRQPAGAEGRHDALLGDRHLRHAEPFCHQRGPGRRHRLDLSTRLSASSEDEPASEYGLVAKSIDLAPDKLSVLYTLRKEARFHDGTPMTPDDVIWTFETLRAKGLPMYRELLRRRHQGRTRRAIAASAFISNRRTTANCRRSSGRCRCLSKAYWSKRDFAKTTLDPPLGSGPYKIEVGRSRPLDHLSPGRRLLGRGSAGQQGPL